MIPRRRQGAPGRRATGQAAWYDAAVAATHTWIEQAIIPGEA